MGCVCVSGGVRDEVKRASRVDTGSIFMHDGHVSLYTLTTIFGPVVCIRVDSPDDPKDDIGEAFGLVGYIFHEEGKIEDLLDDCEFYRDNSSLSFFWKKRALCMDSDGYHSCESSGS